MNIKLTIEAPQLAEAISKLADALQGGLPSLAVTETKAAVQEEKKPTTKKASTPPKESAPVNDEPATEPEETTSEPATEEQEEKEIDVATVRAYLQKLNDAGRQKEAKGIISGMGFTKLSDIPAERRIEVVDAVKELLGNDDE